jgi:transposase
MRGSTELQAVMLTTLGPEDFVRVGHPIRRVKETVDRVLGELSPVFGSMYAETGRPSVPPEHLLKASLLMALFSIRSERQFEDRLRSDLMFKWFLDLNIETPAFDATTFSKNRQRVLEHDVARQFFLRVTGEARRLGLLSDEHFSVDGTLLEAWASMKSFKPRDGGPDGNGGARAGVHDAGAGDGRNEDVDFRGNKRSNATHQSATDPEARLARKGPGKEAKLAYAGHVVIENRNGLVVDATLTQATGTAEEEAAIRMLRGIPGRRRVSVGADKGYDTDNFVDSCWFMNVRAHVAQRQRSAIDGRTARHPGYQASQRARKRVEEVFGWMKTVGGARKLRYKGAARNGLWFSLVAAAYNLVRMSRLLAPPKPVDVAA